MNQFLSSQIFKTVICECRLYNSNVVIDLQNLKSPTEVFLVRQEKSKQQQQQQHSPFLT